MRSQRERYKPINLHSIIYNIVKFFNVNNVYKCSIDEMSNFLNIKKSILHLELVSNVKKHPIITYNVKDREIRISKKKLFFYNEIRRQLYFLKKEYYITDRLIRTILSRSIRTNNYPIFFDNVYKSMYSLKNSSDFITKFVFYKLMMYFTNKYGVLSRNDIRETINWAFNNKLFTCPADLDNLYTIRKDYDDDIIQKDYNYLLKNPIIHFNSRKVKKNMMNDERIFKLLEIYRILKFSDDYCTLNYPSIYPWNFHEKILFDIDEDYLRNIGKSINESIISHKSLCSYLIFSTLNIHHLDIFHKLNEFSLNVNNIIYRNRKGAFHQKIEFPLSANDPVTIGTHFWALTEFPLLNIFINYDWFQNLIVSAIENSKHLTASLNLDEEPDVHLVFLSENIKNQMKTLSNFFGIKFIEKRGKSFYYLTFQDEYFIEKLYRKKDKVIQRRRIYPTSFAFELLEHILKSHPYTKHNLKDICDKFEVYDTEIKLFLENYMQRSVRWSSESLSIKENPWIDVSLSN